MIPSKITQMAEGRAFLGASVHHRPGSKNRLLLKFELSAGSQGVAVTLTCKQCGQRFELDYRMGRPRERCFGCQPVGMRVVSTGRPKQVAWKSEPMPEVLAAVQRDVAEMESAKTSAGIAVLKLAA